MKKLLTLAVALITLIVFSGPGLAQKKQPATGEKKTARGNDAATYEHEMTAKVTSVDPAAKTFTVMIQGKSITFSAAKLNKLPTVGKMIDMTYTWNPDKAPMAGSTTEAGSKAATGEEKGQAGQTGTRSTGASNYTHCSDSPGHHHDPFVTLKLKGGCPWW